MCIEKQSIPIYCSTKQHTDDKSARAGHIPTTSTTFFSFNEHIRMVWGWGDRFV